jgi:hypothetical protein
MIDDRGAGSNKNEKERYEQKRFASPVDERQISSSKIHEIP